MRSCMPRETYVQIETSTGTYPVSERVHRQMIDHAKRHGLTFADVKADVARLIERNESDADADAEIEIYLAAQATPIDCQHARDQQRVVPAPKPRRPGQQRKAPEITNEIYHAYAGGRIARLDARRPRGRR